MTRRLARPAVALVVAALLLLPDVLRLDTWTPFAQLVAFRPILAAAVLCLGVPLVLLRRLRASGVVLTVIAVTAIATIVPRALGSSPEGSGDDRTLTVLAANVAAGMADKADLRGAIRTHHPDVVVLPEATGSYRTALRASSNDARYRGKSARTGASPVAAMSVLVAADMGTVRFQVDSPENFPSIIVSLGPQRGALRIVAFHAYPPLPAATDRWARDLAQLRRWCGPNAPPTIVAGDFNATMGHSALRESMRGCTDTAAALGKGLRGTWPSGLPAWLTPQIDHVMVAGGVEPHRVSFIELDGTDHRAVLARLSIP